MLFLASHPTLVDPFLLETELHRDWAPTLVSGRDHTVHGVLRWLARAFGVQALSDPAVQGAGCRAALDRELTDLAARLGAGQHLLMFPGGRLSRQKTEDRHLESLRWVISGAEKCPDPLYATLARRWPQVTVLEGYGITECSPVVSVNREENPRRGSIGRPLPQHLLRISESQC